MSIVAIQREAFARQGRVIQAGTRTLTFSGGQNRPLFRAGGEGLVQLVTDQTGTEFQFKCFYEPTADRRRRSEVLVKQRLAKPGKPKADALGGAPLDLLPSIGPMTPFGVLMKNVRGSSWKDLKEFTSSGAYPPPWWPNLQVRALWAFGLATAVRYMEEQEFIHADLSPGNVMVTPSGEYAGELALVDFDGFVHPEFPELDTTCRGSEGYSAPEIWNQESIAQGSDRLGLAVLAQEFLLMGDRDLAPDEVKVLALNSGYAQDDLLNRAAGAHELFRRRYPTLARLLDQTLSARNPMERASPDQWRDGLRDLANGNSGRRRMSGVEIVGEGANITVRLGDHEKTVSLRAAFGIRIQLIRNPDGSIDGQVESGAAVRVKATHESWVEHGEGSRFALSPGAKLFDSRGKCRVELRGREQ